MGSSASPRDGPRPARRYRRQRLGRTRCVAEIPIYLSISCERSLMIALMMSPRLIEWIGCQTVVLMRSALTEIDAQSGREIRTCVPSGQAKAREAASTSTRTAVLPMTSSDSPPPGAASPLAANKHKRRAGRPAGGVSRRTSVDCSVVNHVVAGPGTPNKWIRRRACISCIQRSRLPEEQLRPGPMSCAHRAPPSAVGERLREPQAPPCARGTLLVEYKYIQEDDGRSGSGAKRRGNTAAGGGSRAGPPVLGFGASGRGVLWPDRGPGRHAGGPQGQ